VLNVERCIHQHHNSLRYLAYLAHTLQSHRFFSFQAQEGASVSTSVSILST
jgi:hypothetical protein